MVEVGFAQSTKTTGDSKLNSTFSFTNFQATFLLKD